MLSKKKKAVLKRKKKLNGKEKSQRTITLPKRKAGRPPGPKRRLERLEAFLLLAMSELADLKKGEG